MFKPDVPGTRDVNDILSTLTARLTSVLGGNLTGVYVGGSLAFGDFDPASSDIDLLVVTEQPVSGAQLNELAAVHRDVAQMHPHWAKRLEVSYMPRAAVRRHQPNDCLHPTVGETWPFGLDVHDEGWIIQRWIVREHGLALSGPAPATLIDDVSADELRQATLTLLRNDWSRRLQTPEWFATRRYQAYGVLTMCRTEYTLATGRVATKPAAAAWARTALPHRADLIERAIRWRASTLPGKPDETLDFIAEVVGRHA